jgi:hypothetical protein
MTTTLVKQRVHRMRVRRPWWPAFTEAVFEAVRAEADCYRDCTPVMAAIRAPEAPGFPPEGLRMTWLARYLETAQALNELTAAGRVEMRSTRAGSRRRAYRPVC